MATSNGVIETATGDLLRAGYCDFLNDGSFDAGTETYKTDVPVPGKVRNGDAADMHRWNGSAWVSVPHPTVDGTRVNGVKPPVRAATAAALPANTRSGNVFTADANGAFAAVDDVTLALGERFLDKDHVTGANRGINILTQVGDGSTPAKWQRSNDADSDAAMMSGFEVRVTEGTVNAGKKFYLSTVDPITLNTTSLTFTEQPTGGGGGGLDKGCRAYRTTAQAIASGIWVQLDFDNERYDTDSMHSGIRITFNTAGKYMVGGAIEWLANATGRRMVGIRFKATGEFLAIQTVPAAVGGVNVAQNVNTIYDFIAGDWAELQVFQDSGGSLDIKLNTKYSPEFWAQKIDKAG